MPYRFYFLLLCLLGLVACSSSGGRAPVSDIATSTTGKANSSAMIRSKKNSINQSKYTVKTGDTLYGISWRAGVDMNLLIQLNKLKKPYIIKKGQVLQLAADTKSNTEKTKSKSDLASQNVIKNSNSGCTAQNCHKNQVKVVAQEKTKAYSNNDKKTIAKKTELLQDEKISHWSWPVSGKLSKKFSASQTTMRGISIVNKRGSSIHAAAAGKVVYAGNGLRGYGNLIIIKHNDDYLSAYAHNEKLLVRENDEIIINQIIAEMGDSGTDNVHLHFEIRYRGKAVDPLRYLPKK
tara:strand:+ start:22805 stop:23680 length:876 start_codon:yes stop_codon:yes gene_type:complete